MRPVGSMTVAPIDIEPDQTWSATEMLQGDRRGVRVTVHAVENCYYIVLDYLTTWGIERPYTWVIRWTPQAEHGPWEYVRRQATSMLPPGAGFPATPQYETRQHKLQGMLETLTLTALSRVLKDMKDTRP